MPNRLTLALSSLAIAAAVALPAAAAVAQSPSPSPDAVTPPPSPVTSAAPGSSTAAEIGPGGPEGTWQVTAYDAWGDGLVEPLRGSTLTVSLLPQGRLEGETGCGTYIGGYTVDGQSIRLGVISKGPDPCGPRRTDEAFAFTQALAVATSWRASPGGLELLDENGQVRVALVRPGGEGLAGDWVVQRYALSGGRLQDALEGSPATISLGRDGQVGGSTGCRIFAGEYEAETDRLIIAIDVVGLPCDGEERRQDRRIRAVFDSAVRWTRDGSSLLLRDADGELLAELVPATSVTQPPGEVPEAAASEAAASSAPAEPAGSAVPGESGG